jgi:hypothetical protein
VVVAVVVAVFVEVQVYEVVADSELVEVAELTLVLEAVDEVADDVDAREVEEVVLADVDGELLLVSTK